MGTDSPRPNPSNQAPYRGFDQPRAGQRNGRRKSILGPLLLIGLGAVFLAQNFNLVGTDIWTSIWRLWPLLLVAAGIELLVNRSSVLGTIGFVVAILVVASVLTWMTAFIRGDGWTIGHRPTGPEAAGVERVVEDLDGAGRASIELRHGAGRLDLFELPADSPRLIDAVVSHDRDTTIESSIRRDGDLAEVRLRARSDRPLFIGPMLSFGGDGWPGDWTIALSPRVPIELQIRTGASEVDLDLGALQLRELDLRAGASSIRIAMPETSGHTNARIQAGAASVDLTIPEGVAARIRIRGAISDTTIDKVRFPMVGRYYQTPDYETAVNRVDLDIETGVANLTIR